MSEPQTGQATPAIREADVLIVGGGLSGTLLAMQLLRLPGARRIVLVEPRPELGRGEAYSATELGHTLNGNAARMSIEPDDADDLTRRMCRSVNYSRPGGCLVCIPSSAWRKH